MTVSLGDVTLSDNIILGGIENAPLISHSARRTLGGRLVVQTGPPLVGGRTLTLKTENHFTLRQIEAIKVLEAGGAPVTLVHHRGTFNVLITGVTCEPTIEYADPEPDDWYSGTITMLEV